MPVHGGSVFLRSPPPPSISKSFFDEGNPAGYAATHLQSSRSSISNPHQDPSHSHSYRFTRSSHPQQNKGMRRQRRSVPGGPLLLLGLLGSIGFFFGRASAAAGAAAGSDSVVPQPVLVPLRRSVRRKWGGLLCMMMVVAAVLCIRFGSA